MFLEQSAQDQTSVNILHTELLSMETSDMKFVKKFTPPDSQAKNFTPLILPNFNSFGDKNTKMSKNGEIYTAGKKFTLPPAVTALTNSISGVV